MNIFNNTNDEILSNKNIIEWLKEEPFNKKEKQI